MFEKLFVKTSDLVFHKIAPYAVERERFLEHCCEEGFSKAALSRIAGIVATAACDLHAHGGLDGDQKPVEAAAARVEVIPRQAGIRDDAREYPPLIASRRCCLASRTERRPARPESLTRKPQRRLGYR
jgi:hypothetical protein